MERYFKCFVLVNERVNFILKLHNIISSLFHRQLNINKRNNFDKLEMVLNVEGLEIFTFSLTSFLKHSKNILEKFDINSIFISQYLSLRNWSVSWSLLWFENFELSVVFEAYRNYKVCLELLMSKTIATTACRYKVESISSLHDMS